MSDGLSKLLGDKLQLKEETVTTASISQSAKAVGLYFSAHWCPPCKGFTPKLAEWYKNFKESPRAAEMEMIFISSDRDDASFKEYYAEMPWHALPFADRDRKASLSKKFKVSGIPTLLILDAKTGDIIVKNARGKIEEDPKGDNFPWHPKPLSEMLKGPVITKDGEKDLTTLLDGKVRALYFSAHWCPPCRGFTPDLVKSYKKLQEDGRQFEIVFVSWDRDEEQFQEYFKEMPWVSFPLNDPRAKSLGSHFEIDGIPSLVIMDENNKVITANGRGAVSSDPEGKEFPWWPKPVNELASMAAGLINEAAALIYLVGDDNIEEKEKDALALMKPVAEKYFADRKANPQLEELNFFYESKNSDDLPDSLSSFANLDDARPLLFILNIPDQEKYIHQADKITPAELEDVVNKFKTSSLALKPLRG